MKLLKVTLSLIVLLSSNAFAAVKLLESNDKTMLLNVTEQYTLGDNDTLKGQLPTMQEATLRAFWWFRIATSQQSK